jgi:hypothetical protein
MQALAAARAPTFQQRKERSQTKQQKGIKEDKQRQDNRIYLRKLSLPLGTQHILCPRR